MDILKYYQNQTCCGIFALEQDDRILSLGSSSHNHYVVAGSLIEDEHLKIRFSQGRYRLMAMSRKNMSMDGGMIPLHAWLEMPIGKKIWFDNEKTTYLIIEKSEEVIPDKKKVLGESSLKLKEDDDTILKPSPTKETLEKANPVSKPQVKSAVLPKKTQAITAQQRSRITQRKTQEMPAQKSRRTSSVKPLSFTDEKDKNLLQKTQTKSIALPKKTQTISAQIRSSAKPQKTKPASPQKVLGFMDEDEKDPLRETQTKSKALPKKTQAIGAQPRSALTQKNKTPATPSQKTLDFIDKSLPSQDTSSSRKTSPFGQTQARNPALGSNQKSLNSTQKLEFADEQATTDYKIEKNPQLIDGKYTVLGILGKGGMGTVYRARDEKLKRMVAIKVLSKETSLEAKERFLIEARAIARLQNPHIVKVHDIGFHNKKPYYAMDIVEGEELQKCLTPFRPRDFLGWMLTICQALDYVHQGGIIHRDLKPANIIISKDGPILMDFGIARDEYSQSQLTSDGQSIGTPAYMSPEQAKGRVSDIDGRTDVYGLGAILYEILTGQVPFSGPPMQVLYKICYVDPEPIANLNKAVSKDLIAIVEKAMAKEKSLRYNSALEMADDIKRYLEGTRVKAQPTTSSRRFFRRLKQNRSLTYTFSASAFTFIAVITFIWFNNFQNKSKIEAELDRDLFNAAKEFENLDTKSTVADYIKISELYNKVLAAQKQNEAALKGKFNVLIKMGDHALKSHNYTLAEIMYNTALAMNFDNSRAEKAIQNISVVVRKEREDIKNLVQEVFQELE